MKEPIVQIAIDTTTIKEAKKVVEKAIAAGADWIEIGNPLIKFEGLKVVEKIRSEYPNIYIIVDLMIMAGPDKYVKAIKEFGGDNVTITALAPDKSIESAIKSCEKYNIKSTVDLFNVDNIVDEAIKYEKMGADYLMVHYGVDQKKYLTVKPFLKQLKDVSSKVSIPISYATYGINEALDAVENGADIIVQGEPLISNINAGDKLSNFIKKVKEGNVQ